MKSDFIVALTQLAAERNLPREIVLSAIEDALVSAFKRDKVAAAKDISVKLDPGSGDVVVSIVKTVVEEVADPEVEMTVAEAKEFASSPSVGDIVPISTLPNSAGRIAAQTAKQVVIQRLREAERELVFSEYAGKEGEVYNVTVQRVEPKQVVVELGRAEAVLPVSEQSQYERYRVGQRFKVILLKIGQSNRGPELVVSRADQGLVKRLFEMEVPEIYNGAVEIISIAREAGSRSKVSVVAKQEGVDAVGSCVGLRGIRIQNIVNELHGEKIDVVEWSEDSARFIKNGLSPAVVTRVDLNPEEGTAVAVVPERQLSLAIGKEGQNARLAARMTGLKIDIISDVEAEALDVERTDTVTADTTAEEPISQEDDVAEAEIADIDEAEIKEHEIVAEVDETPASEPEASTDESEPEASTDETEEEQNEEQEEDSPAIDEQILEELFIEDKPTPDETVPVGADSTSLADLPDDIWNISRQAGTEPGVIRFAEDIEEVARRSAGTGRRKRGAGNNRNRRPPRRR